MASIKERGQERLDVELREQECFGMTLGTTTDRPQVVIVGAGFGGIDAARALGNHDVDVLVLNRGHIHDHEWLSRKPSAQCPAEA